MLRRLITFFIWTTAAIGLFVIAGVFANIHPPFSAINIYLPGRCLMLIVTASSSSISLYDHHPKSGPAVPPRSLLVLGQYGLQIVHDDQGDFYSDIRNYGSAWSENSWHRGQLSVGVWRPTARPGPTLRLVQFPTWLVLATSFAPIATAGVIRWRHPKKPRPGLCAACGYDLRATPARCPECGAVCQ